MGVAIAELFQQMGWAVDLTGRDPARMPSHLAKQGVRFHAIDRSDSEQLTRLIGHDTNLVVDLVAYCAADVEALLPMLSGVGSTVIASSRAVYIDAEGRHINGDVPPQFSVPVAEVNPTLDAATPDINPFSREGYGPSKVALERTALASGLPITIIRPSKVHGPWARNPRTQGIVEQMLSDAEFIELADRGVSIDHLSAAANVARLVQQVARSPGSRILNAADPDPLKAIEIIESIATALGWNGEIRALDSGITGGEHPWYQPYPIVLDMAAAASLGYQAAGPGKDLLQAEAVWVAARIKGRQRTT